MENSTLSDLEGNSLSEICVIKLGETSIPVTLKLITIGVSAKGLYICRYIGFAHRFPLLIYSICLGNIVAKFLLTKLTSSKLK